MYSTTLLAIASLWWYADTSSFDNLIARLLPVYVATVLFVFVGFLQYSKTTSSTRPEYALKKGGAAAASKQSSKGATPAQSTPASWKHQFVGTWDKIERPGFKEFAMFLGNSSFTASIAERASFGNIISFKDSSEKELKIDSTGTPAQAGVWCELGGGAVEAKDPKGKPIIEKLWWDELNQKLCRSLCSPADDPNGSDMTQIREVRPDGKMVTFSKLTRRKDGQVCEFHTVFVRK